MSAVITVLLKCDSHFWCNYIHTLSPSDSREIHSRHLCSERLPQCELLSQYSLSDSLIWQCQSKWGKNKNPRAYRCFIELQLSPTRGQLQAYKHVQTNVVTGCRQMVFRHNFKCLAFGTVRHVYKFKCIQKKKSSKALFCSWAAIN